MNVKTSTTNDSSNDSSKSATDTASGAQNAPQTGFVNNNPMNSRVYAKQDPRKYQFTAPSNYYISNNSQFTSQERMQFEFLDTLNIMLDTAIALHNQGRTIAASRR